MTYVGAVHLVLPRPPPGPLHLRPKLTVNTPTLAGGYVTLMKFIVARLGALGSVYAHEAHRDLLKLVKTGWKWWSG